MMKACVTIIQLHAEAWNAYTCLYSSCQVMILSWLIGSIQWLHSIPGLCVQLDDSHTSFHHNFLIELYTAFHFDGIWYPQKWKHPNRSNSPINQPSLSSLPDSSGAAHGEQNIVLQQTLASWSVLKQIVVSRLFYGNSHYWKWQCPDVCVHMSCFWAYPGSHWPHLYVYISVIHECHCVSICWQLALQPSGKLREAVLCGTDWWEGCCRPGWTLQSLDTAPTGRGTMLVLNKACTDKLLCCHGH